MTPVFQNKKPERVYAGIVRYETQDYMDIRVFPYDFTPGDRLAYMEREDSWEAERQVDIDIHSHELVYSTPDPNKPDWEQLITDFGNRGTRYTQIYPPISGDK